MVDGFRVKYALTHPNPFVGHPAALKPLGCTSGRFSYHNCKSQRIPAVWAEARQSNLQNKGGSVVRQIAFAKLLGLLIRNTLRFTLIAALLATNAGLAWSDDDAGAAAATAGEVAHKKEMRSVFPDPIMSGQPTPNVISQHEMDRDPGGMIATYQPSGSTQTAKNAFFQDFGRNGRTCFTCHQPQDGWTISAQHAQARFEADPNDPLFRLVDGATCPSADVSTLDAKRAAYTLLTTRGLIRIGLPIQATMEFQILGVSDPYGCSTNAITGLTDPKSGIVS